jgi:hypothetical protein
MADSEQTPKEETEKYKQLYTMAEAAFRDEDNRYNRIEDNALKYVPVIVFLFGIGSFFAKWALEKLVHLQNWIEILAIMCIVLAFFSLIYAALLLLWSRRYGQVRLFRPDEQDVRFFDTYDLPTIYRAYADRFNEEREINARITDKKVERGNRVYDLIFTSFALFVFTGLIYVIHSLMSSK